MKLLLLLFITCITLSSFGQHLIKGSVSDADGEVPFVNVTIKNSTKGVLADETGHFVIEAQTSDILQISTLGYQTKEVLVGNQKQLKIVLDQYEALDEVLLVGYTWHTKCSTRGCGYAVVCECFVDEIDENEEENRETKAIAKLYPNPSKDGVFNLVLTNDFSSVDIVVADLTGRIILNTSYSKLGSRISVDLSQQPSGIFIVNLSSQGKLITSKKAVRI